MKTLDLVLKHKWWDMIHQGIKKSEYREITPFWASRLLEEYKNGEWVRFKRSTIDRNELIEMSIDGTIRFKNFTFIRFRKGYTNTDMVFTIKEIKMDNGNTEWGAEKNKEYFVINFE